MTQFIKPDLTRRSLHDIIVVGACIACAALTLPRLDAFEWLSSHLRRQETLQLDDLLLTLGVGIVALLWFAFRRWQDAQAQLRALCEADRERQRHLQRVQWLSSELLATEEQERQRVAEALHDGVVQTLYACRLKLELHGRVMTDPALRTSLDEALALVEQSMERTRDLTLTLSPPILHDLGLREAIDWLQQKCSKQFGITMKFDRAPVWDEVDPRHRTPVFHSVRELLVNAGKHANASRVAVSARAIADGRIEVNVSDDGQGFDVPTQRTIPSFGLFSIERRLSCINGKLDIRSTPGHGTTALLELPNCERKRSDVIRCAAQ